MNVWGILAIVLSIAVIALVGFTIPILIQVKDLLKSVETTVGRLEKDVEPVIHNVNGIVQNFEGITEAANTFVHRKPKVSDEPNLIDKLKENVESSSKLVKEEYIPLINKKRKDYFYALKVGLRVGINTFKSSSSNQTSLIEMPNTDIVIIPDTTKEIVLVK